MQTLSFYCLPSQLDDWVRKRSNIPGSVRFRLSVYAEHLFKCAFPHIRKYEVEPDRCRTRSGNQMILIYERYREHSTEGRIGHYSVIEVMVYDRVSGTPNALMLLEKEGLLDQVIFKQKVAEIWQSADMRYEMKKSEEKKNVRKTIQTLSIIVSTFLIIFILIIFFGYMTLDL